MLFILELIFLIAGLWSLISAKLPEGLFRLLFGKGIYKLAPNHARLYGLLLASPYPISLTVTFLLAVIFGEKSTGIALIFENIYFYSILITSLIIARKIRKPVEQQERTNNEASDHPETISYRKRLLIITGIVVLSLITLTSIVTSVTTVYAIINYGFSTTGKFSEDILPFILLFGSIGIGIFGIYKLIRLLRNKDEARAT